MSTKQSIFSARHLAEIPLLVKTSSSDLGVQAAISRLARMMAEDSERGDAEPPDSGRFFRRIAAEVSNDRRSTAKDTL